MAASLTRFFPSEVSWAWATSYSPFLGALSRSTQLKNNWRFRLFSGCWGEVQGAAVEVDRMDEVLFVAEAAGRVLHPLDLGVDGLASRVGEAAFEHAGDFDHGTQTAAHRPTVPPLEMLPRRAFIDVVVQAHGCLFQGPGTGRLRLALP